jgi:ribonucleotide reductase alpha subunit
MGDSITDIYKTIEECAHLGAGGGGLGVYMGDIRGHGAPIRKTLKSSGTIPFMKVLDSNTLAISQGSTRRASAAIYLDISHPDCEEYINIRKPTGGDENRKCLNIHHGVNITDDFMQAVNKKESFNIICPHTKEVVKTIDARTLWKGILKSRIETGEPFIFYKDTANREILPTHRDKGLFIKQSNLCCTPGHTLILTDKGHIPIKDLVGVPTNVWNGHEWSAVTPEYTGDKEIYEITLSDGNSLKCSGNHKFHLDSLIDNEPIIVEAVNLKEGDLLSQCKTPQGEDHQVRVTVIAVSSTGMSEPTYCFNEPKNHTAIFNGVYTGQSEIILPTNKDRTAICVLGSINIEQCPIGQLEYVSAIATEALDNVLTLFLKTANPRDYKRAIYSASKERSIGLGLMGWHGYLMREKIPFEGVQSVALAKIISEKIQNAARAKSIELAKTKGECEDNPGNRNSYLTAIAPTANISIIAGNCTPCIEPIAGNAYLQKTLSGSFLVKNVYLENLLKEKGQNTAKVWKSIIKNAGSVQQLDFLSEEEKKLFKTAYELDQRFIVKQAAARQKHICQAQSLNLFFGRTENGEIDGMYLHQVHYEAWESGVKTLYYLRSDSVLSAKINTEECVACQ